MIYSIDGVELPFVATHDIKLDPRIFAKRTTVDGTLITSEAVDKWRVQAIFEGVALTLAKQSEFYAACIKARTTPVAVVFDNPYMQTKETKMCKCTEIGTPQTLQVNNTVQVGVGATFEEV